MRYFFGCMAAFSVASVVYHLVRRRHYRAQGVPVPIWHAGDIAGDLAFLCIALSMLLLEHDQLSIVFSGSGLLLIAVAAYRNVMARRRVP
jgi:hypothetical protein